MRPWPSISAGRASKHGRILRVVWARRAAAEVPTLRDARARPECETEPPADGAPGPRHGVVNYIAANQGFGFADYGAELRAFVRREDILRLTLRIGDQIEFTAREDDRGRGPWASDVVRP